MAYQELFFYYETFSLVDLSEVGIDNYAKHPLTGISMLAWAFDDEDVEIWLPHCEAMPQKLLDGMRRNPAILKIAWNASFEYNITKYVLHRSGRGKELPAFDVPMAEWRDPMILGHNLSLPGKLEKVAIILKMAEQKDPRGDELKFMFCKPVSHGGSRLCSASHHLCFATTTVIQKNLPSTSNIANRTYGPSARCGTACARLAFLKLNGKAGYWIKRLTSLASQDAGPRRKRFAARLAFHQRPETNLQGYHWTGQSQL